MAAQGSSESGQRWAVLLAAGEGKRVRKLTHSPDGVEVPKQYYAWGGAESMLQWTLKRSAAVAPPERTVAVVAKQHEPWWSSQLAGLPRENVVVQPRNRGTGAGILFPVVEILRRDPDARLAVMPTDHHVEHEPRLQAAIAAAFEAVEDDLRKVVLVGIEPRQWETGYGWIVPSGPSGRIQRVDTFVEKPDETRGKDLMQAGALMNSFIFVGTAAAIYRMVDDTVPEVARRLGIWQQAVQRTAARLESLYEAMPSCDFSREVLEQSCATLAVVRAHDCEWTDLGTPDRVQRYQARQPA